jgi:hypothetical protein
VESAKSIDARATMSFAFALPVHHHTSSGALEQISPSLAEHMLAEREIERMEMD